MEDMNFEEMRSQLALLKEKIESQSVINDKMMHEIVRTKTDSIWRKQFVSVICGIFVMLTCPITFREAFHCSWYFIIATELLMLWCVYKEYSFKRIINDKKMMGGSMLEVAQATRDFKNGYRNYTIFNIFLGVIWVIWLIVEVYFSFGNEIEYFWGMVAGLVVGLLVGGGIGFWLYLRIMNTAQDIIRQIEEE